MSFVRTQPFTNRTALYGVLAFFAIIFAANGAFIYFALSSWPGLVSETAYQDGLQFNADLSQAETQRSRGWQSKLSVGTNSVLHLRIADRNGKAVSGLAVSARLTRPAHDRDDQDVPLRPGPGGAYVSLPVPNLTGAWRVRILAKAPTGETYRRDIELMVAP
ncbi:MAG: FixH family protein [Proteobacteria bacterium]|nr:FixH family protein [Pseudomonadota bacterium]